MAKPAGGPKAPKQQGHWDKDEWNEEPDKFDTHHWSETPELGQVPYFFMCVLNHLSVGVLDGIACEHTYCFVGTLFTVWSSIEDLTTKYFLSCVKGKDYIECVWNF